MRGMDCAWMWQADCVYDSTATAAWVQAVGSVVAILASSALAIFVPVWMKDRDDKGAAFRAIQTSSYAAGQMISAWGALRAIVAQDDYHAGTSVAVMVGVNTARAMLEEVPHALLSPMAATHLHSVALSAASLDDVLVKMDRSKDPGRIAGAIPFDRAIEKLKVSEAAFMEMVPRKRHGFWTSGDSTDSRREVP